MGSYLCEWSSAQALWSRVWAVKFLHSVSSVDTYEENTKPTTKITAGDAK